MSQMQGSNCYFRNKKRNVDFVFWHNLTHIPNRYLLMEDLSEAFMLYCRYLQVAAQCCQNQQKMAKVRDNTFSTSAHFLLLHTAKGFLCACAFIYSTAKLLEQFQKHLERLNNQNCLRLHKTTKETILTFSNVHIRRSSLRIVTNTVIAITACHLYVGIHIFRPKKDEDFIVIASNIAPFHDCYNYKF